MEDIKPRIAPDVVLKQMLSCLFVMSCLILLAFIHST